MTARSRMLPDYSAALRELQAARRLGCSTIGPDGKIKGGYIATDELSNIALMAAAEREKGNLETAARLESAAWSVARAQAVAIVAARRGHVRMKPKRKNA